MRRIHYLPYLFPFASVLKFFKIIFSLFEQKIVKRSNLILRPIPFDMLFLTED